MTFMRSLSRILSEGYASSTYDARTCHLQAHPPSHAAVQSANASDKVLTDFSIAASFGFMAKTQHGNDSCKPAKRQRCCDMSMNSAMHYG